VKVHGSVADLLHFVALLANNCGWILSISFPPPRTLPTVCNGVIAPSADPNLEKTYAAFTTLPGPKTPPRSSQSPRPLGSHQGMVTGVGASFTDGSCERHGTVHDAVHGSWTVASDYRIDREGSNTRLEGTLKLFRADDQVGRSSQTSIRTPTVRHIRNEAWAPPLGITVRHEFWPSVPSSEHSLFRLAAWARACYEIAECRRLWNPQLEGSYCRGGRGEVGGGRVRGLNNLLLCSSVTKAKLYGSC